MTNPILSSTADPFLTTKEAALRLGVTLRTVRLWVNDGKLQAACTPGGHRRIRTSDVRVLQERMGIKPAKAVVLLTDERLDALADEVFDLIQDAPDDDVGDRTWDRMFGRAVQAAVLAANGLGADHA